jgi:putative ubiquitin-RnfH superfamily antitoxin RatB of RatAB toxin-antitoxin module
MLTVEVIFATPEEQKLLVVQVPEASSIEQCIQLSGVLDHYPEIDLSIMKVGLFSQIKPLDHTVIDGDRIEIYRPLIADPKEVRRKRAAQAPIRR